MEGGHQALAIVMGRAALVAAGDGDTTNALWTNDGGVNTVPWDNTLYATDTAVFGFGHLEGSTSVGTVSPAGGIQVGSLRFNKSYAFGGGSITLNEGIIDVASGVTARFSPFNGVSLRGDAGLTKTGAGTLYFGRLSNTSYTGGTYINAGTLEIGFEDSTYTGNLVNPDSGVIHLLDTEGSADATLRVGSASASWGIANDIVVRTGSTGNATIEYRRSNAAAAFELSGDLTLGKSLSLDRVGNNAVSITLSGDISGPGDLSIDQSGVVNQASPGNVTLSGDNTNHTGATFLKGNSATNTSAFLNSIQGNSKLTLDNIAVSGTGTLQFNIVDDDADLIQLLNSATLDLSGLTLKPILSGIQTQSEYALTNRLTGVTGQFASIIGSPQYAFLVDYDGTDANPNSVVLILTPIPEPAAMSLLAIGALPLLLRRRKA